MSRYHPRQQHTGRPRVTMHLEAKTEACPCPKLDCGGISTDRIRANCPEHGFNQLTLDPLVKFHTHPAQVEGVNRGLHIA